MIFTPILIRKFRAAYNSAKKANEESFVFEGHEFLVAYAKYLLQYLGG